MSFAQLLNPEPTTDADEMALFLAEMSGIAPLTQNSVRQPREVPHADALLARRSAAEQESDLDPDFLSMEYVELRDPHDILEFKRDGVQEGVYKKLRLGRYELQASLDLHRHTLKQAKAALLEFLRDCRECEVRSVLIRHGKGERSNPKALLKSYVSEWLRQWPEVLAYHSAQRMHGGSGALYVLLRKSERQKQETRERIYRHLP